MFFLKRDCSSVAPFTEIPCFSPDFPNLNQGSKGRGRCMFFFVYLMFVSWGQMHSVDKCQIQQHLQLSLVWNTCSLDGILHKHTQLNRKTGATRAEIIGIVRQHLYYHLMLRPHLKIYFFSTLHWANTVHSHMNLHSKQICNFPKTNCQFNKLTDWWPVGLFNRRHFVWSW